MNKIMGILMLLVYVCVASALLSDAFTTPFNMQNIVRYTALYGIIGIGVSLVIITGGIDLSIGSMIGLTGCLLPMALTDWEWSVPMSLLLVMIVAVVLGLAHGLLITKLNLQPFIVTLCGLMIYRGLGRWITGDATQGFGSDYDDSLRLLAIGKPCSVAFLIMTTGLLTTLFGLYRLLFHSKDGEDNNTPLWGVVVLIGVGLALAGSSRYWQGVTFETGETVLTLAGSEIKTFSAEVSKQAAGAPAFWMKTLGLALLAPSLIWLFVVSFSKDVKKAATATGGLILGTLIVAGAAIIAMNAKGDWGAKAAWCQTWRMPTVFVGLAIFMASVGWFIKSMLAIAGKSAQAPLLLAGVSAALALVGLTPLGQTLVPAPFLILLVMALIASVFLNQTIYGRYLLALGRNEEAARYSGIQTKHMIILAYVLCGAASGIGGILFALDGNSIQPSGHGNFLELYAIAAAVLGGCSLRGGEGSILGVIIGAAVMRVLYNSINILGIPSQLEFTIIGTVILFGVLADELVKRVAIRRANIAAAEST
ncbi:MAG: hypothetical protein KDA80_17855 [Planctomycetaceae bacterium]|nr:hypothetical protein [Planctomycetaceae bacterium]